MKKILLLVFIALCLNFLQGCASSNPGTNGLGGTPPSDIPWNRPQSWEGQGQLGGMLGQ